MDKRWAQAAMPREQQVLFAQSLDEAVEAEHPIRQLDALLNQLNWQEWEKEYNGHRGQPAIHPRLMAGSILYGLMLRIQSSRGLEDATVNRLDFRWFLEGRRIDHSTFAEFRTAHGDKLQGLFSEITRRICSVDQQALLTLVIDGTRIRANSDRHGARTGQWLRRRVDLCQEELNRRMSLLAQTDEGLAGAEAEQLRSEIARLDAEVAKYKRALEQAQKRDEVKQAKRGRNKAAAVCVPVTDPDSMIVPNKEGGFAPNYTPTLAVDAATGAIISALVPEGSDEAGSVLPAIEQARQLANITPQIILADTSFASGENLQALEEQGIEAYMPTGTDFSPENPANREDPTQPVPEAQRDKLPKRNDKFTRSAFVYDGRADEYRCPMGQAMTRQGASKEGDKCTYRCPGATGCPLAKYCVKSGAPARIIIRDHYQHYREKVGKRMAAPAGKELYKKRAPIGEGPNARIKHGMNFRRFLLRGIKKVRMEWLWVCISYNLKLLLHTKTGQNEQEKQIQAAIEAQNHHLCTKRTYFGMYTFITRMIRTAIHPPPALEIPMRINTPCWN